MIEELDVYLNSLARDENYRVDAVLKESAYEVTQRVFFEGSNGAEIGPFIRKRAEHDSGLGAAYERLFKAQQAGRRFAFLPRVFDWYDTGEERVVIMEYVQGETLDEYVERLGPSLDVAVSVFPRLCCAVRELHESFDPPIIHRDLKPSNVIVANESLTLIDFGIARTFSSEAEEDTRHFGTRPYAPPEQFGYRQTDARSDVYALGVLLFFCLTGHVPSARTRADEFSSPLVPEPLRRVIARAAAFDPDQRFAHVGALQEAFERAIEECAGECGCDKAQAADEQVAEEQAYVGEQAAGEQAAADAGSVAPVQSTASVQDVAPAQGGACRQDAAVTRAPFDATRAKSRWQRISPVIGAIWTVFVLLVFCVFFLVVTTMIFDPQPGQVDEFAPLALRFVSNYVMLFFFLGPLCYLLLDPRLKARIPILGRCSRAREFTVCLALILIGFCAYGAMAQFF